MDSILNSIKKLLGSYEDDTDFDIDLIININTALAILTQLGVGPSEGFSITGSTETWSDFIDLSMASMEQVKLYVYLRVKLIFDPPMSSTVIEAYKRQMDELEWRLLHAVEIQNASDGGG